MKIVMQRWILLASRWHFSCGKNQKQRNSVLLFENHLAICLATHDPLREVWVDLTPERFIYSPTFVRSNDRPERWWGILYRGNSRTSMTRQQISSCRSHSHLSFSLGDIPPTMQIGESDIIGENFWRSHKLKKWLIFKYSLVGLGYTP